MSKNNNSKFPVVLNPFPAETGFAGIIGQCQSQCPRWPVRLGPRTRLAPRLVRHSFKDGGTPESVTAHYNNKLCNLCQQANAFYVRISKNGRAVAAAPPILSGSGLLVEGG
jgi:hypothetical protein